MNTQRILIAAGMLGALCAAGTTRAQQNGDEALQRDVRQQQRIEQGLQSGQLSTGEAARLERGEARIDRMESRDLSRGPLTAREQAQIDRAQNRESEAIWRDKHNGVTGDPDSRSARRMEDDVQRNVNQERRIDNGIREGQLDNGEAARLERGQANVDRREWRAGRDGWVNGGEQAHIQRTEDHQSLHIAHARRR